MSCPLCSRSIEIVESLQVKNARLIEFAHLVETVLEAEECNGVGGPDGMTVTLPFAWFKRARELFVEVDREG